MTTQLATLGASFICLDTQLLLRPGPPHCSPRLCRSCCLAWPGRHGRPECDTAMRERCHHHGKAGILSLALQALCLAHSISRLLLQKNLCFPRRLPSVPTKPPCRTTRTRRHLLPFSPLRSGLDTFPSQVGVSASGCSFLGWGLCKLSSAFPGSPATTAPGSPGYVQRGNGAAFAEHLLGILTVLVFFRYSNSEGTMS